MRNETLRSLSGDQFVKHVGEPATVDTSAKRLAALDMLKVDKRELSFDEIKRGMAAFLPTMHIKAAEKLNELSGDKSYLFHVLESYLLAPKTTYSHSGELVNVEDMYKYYAGVNVSYESLHSADVEGTKRFAELYAEGISKRVERVKKGEADLYDSALIKEDRNKAGSILHLACHIEQWRVETAEQIEKNPVLCVAHCRNATSYALQSAEWFKDLPEKEHFYEGAFEPQLDKEAYAHMAGMHSHQEEERARAASPAAEMVVYQALKAEILSGRAR